MSKELEALSIIKNIELSHVEYDEDEDFNGDWVFETVEKYDGTIDDNYYYSEQIDIIEKALLRLEAIDQAKPSEALKCLERMWCDLPQYYEEEYNTVKQALLKAQEQEKVLSIIKEKNVDMDILTDVDTLEEYNSKMNWSYRRLTQEEFSTLKEWSQNDNENS